MKPLSIVLVRHGKSTSNSILKHLSEGDKSDLTPEVLALHDSQFPLSDRGRGQSVAAGSWLKENIYQGKFDYHFVSPFRRTLETAYLLDLPEAAWRMDDRLREIDWGISSFLTDEERLQMYPREMELLRQSPFSARRPGGESGRDVVIRVHDFLGTLYREAVDQKVVVVCHGEVIRGFRYLLERQTEHDYEVSKLGGEFFEQVNNCQIFEYTRVNPEDGTIEDGLNWWRTVCPWDTSRSSNNWRRIERKMYSNQELERYVESYFDRNN